jgi:hypothetical protein
LRPELLSALRTELGSHFSAERAERVRRLVLEDAAATLAESDKAGTQKVEPYVFTFIDALLSE